MGDEIRAFKARYANLRAIFRIIDDKNFDDAYAKAPEEVKRKIHESIAHEDKTYLVRFMREIYTGQPETVAELRKIAGTYGIKGYAYLQRDELVEAIYLAEKRRGQVQ